jgi:hypothetical protein
MSRLKRFFIPSLLFVFLSSPCIAAQLRASLQNRPPIEAQSISTDRQPGSKSTVLGWLESVMTQFPSDEQTASLRTGIKTSSVRDDRIQPELEASVSPHEPQITGPQDASFPKPANIPALYTSPPLEGEGIWTSKGLPKSEDGTPLIYKTVYRPSADFPNSIVYMAEFNMHRIKARYFVGQEEPGVYQISRTSYEQENLSKIVAITNAMWMEQHSRGAGAIFRGQVIYPMVPGMATLVIYRDNSVDIVDWSDDIPLDMVEDARQLRYLIVKDGAVVRQVVEHGKLTDSEIGLGGFLVDASGRSTMKNQFWFLANRTAFGIRPDGNVVFAMGHHISTKDLAKALVLAGCKRAIHGDANIHNIVCNFYFRDANDKIVKRERLSPEQLKYTLKRYDRGYAKDFFAFYEK